jgi:uncharacterized protein YecE (DUF72 family)
MRLNNLFAGLSGLQMPPKYRFPVEFQNTSRLHYYSVLFNSIEINSSFYKVPQGKTIEKWTRETSENFKFTFKVWKQITHNKFLDFNEVDVYSFLESVSHSGSKKGCLLIQLPPSTGIEYTRQLEQLLIIFNQYNKSREWDLAIEFRNSSWYCNSTYDMCIRNNFCIVIHDIKKSTTPFLKSAHLIKYVRFHGPDGNYRGSYSEDFLSEYAGYVREWITEGNKVYVYFNNTAGDAFGNLERFIHLLKG